MTASHHSTPLTPPFPSFSPSNPSDPTQTGEEWVALVESQGLLQSDLAALDAALDCCPIPTDHILTPDGVHQLPDPHRVAAYLSGQRDLLLDQLARTSSEKSTKSK